MRVAYSPTMDTIVALLYRYHLYAQGGGLPLSTKEIAALIGPNGTPRIAAFVSSDNAGAPVEIFKIGLGGFACTDVAGIEVGDSVEVMIDCEHQSYCFSAVVSSRGGNAQAALGMRLTEAPAFIWPQNQTVAVA